MCLAVPGKLIEIADDHGLRMGRVDYAGTRRAACLEYVPEAAIGDYVIVHAGFAISVLDEEQARRSFETWDAMIRAAESGGDSR